MRWFVLSISLLILTGCQEGEWRVNQELRAKLFQQCLQLVPKGPDNTKYNDWAEVIGECEDAAYFQSQYFVRYGN